MYSCVRSITYLSNRYLPLYLQIYEIMQLAHIEHTNQWIHTVAELNYIHIVFLLFVALQTCCFFGGVGAERGCWERKVSRYRNKFATGNRRIGALHLQITSLTFIVLCTDIYISSIVLKFDQCIC